MFRAYPSSLGRRGVTLIEVVVVVAIIATLAGLLLPVLVRSRGRAQVTTCATNLKNLYQAFAMYAQDNDGRLPPYQNRIGISVACKSPSCGGPWERPIPEHGKELVAVLKPYTKSDDLWFCPADPFARTDSEEGKVRHRYTSYRTNIELGKQEYWGDRVTLDGYLHKGWFGNPDRTVDDVSRLVLLDDNLWPYFPHPGISSVMPPYSHLMTFNYLHWDGHVKSLPWKAAR